MFDLKSQNCTAVQASDGLKYKTFDYISVRLCVRYGVTLNVRYDYFIKNRSTDDLSIKCHKRATLILNNLIISLIRVEKQADILQTTESQNRNPTHSLKLL